MRPACGYWRIAFALVVAAVVSCSGADPQTNSQPTAPSPSASGAGLPAPAFATLVFSRTEGFRHDSIPAGIVAIRQLGQQRGFSVDATEDGGMFADDVLAKYKVIVFLSTTGDVLNGAQQAAFERFIRGGGGFVGIHSAADTE